MFSSSLMLADMDYIAPSQACTKPTMSKAPAASAGTVFRHGDADAPPPEVLKISLQDCLACSGCVTSAETMLVTIQSKEELRNTLASTTQQVVVTISEQSASSLAAQWGRSLAFTYDVIARFSRSVLGAKHVIALEWAEAVALRLTVDEYLFRVAHEPHTLPMIVSSCPGWVCYCEKQYPELLPHLSRVMSPQGVAGSMLKRVLGMDSVYHVSVQPCFDRKLEAARDGEATESTTETGEEQLGTRYTDCVLSSHEVLEWMLDAAGDATPCERWGPTGTLAGLDESPNVSLHFPRTKDVVHADDEEDAGRFDEWVALQGSGGYHQRVLHAVVQQEKEARSLSWREVRYETKRNANHRLIRTPVDAQLLLPQPLPQNGATQHLFCVAYGFQHIQNIVRGLRKRLSTTPLYTFIELMACPSGCLNGGGQVRTTAHEETLQQVRRAFVDHRTAHDDGAHDHGDCHSPIAKVPRTDRGIAAMLEVLLHDMLRPGGTDTTGVSSCAAAVATTQFHDRKKEMEEILKANPMHSLKW